MFATAGDHDRIRAMKQRHVDMYARDLMQQRAKAIAKGEKDADGKPLKPLSLAEARYMVANGEVPEPHSEKTKAAAATRAPAPVEPEPEPEPEPGLPDAQSDR